MDGYEFATKPKAIDSQIITGDKWRLSILTDGLVRCEWAEDGQFEDRASTFAINRELPAAKFQSYEAQGALNIVTDRFHLTYDKKPFSASGLFVFIRGKGLHSDYLWRYPNFESSLGGTARTLDDVDGRCELGPGVVSRRGYAALDDKDSMLFDGKNWVASRRPGAREDLYVFAYGTDYRAAIKTFFAVSGKQPLVPRFTFGNWWSRYHRYSSQEYLDLMDRFAAEKVPLSVAVIDMDWHLVDDPRVTHRGWTGYSWDKKLFPDPSAFLKKLRDSNLKTCLNDHPADGVHAFEDVYESMAKEMGWDTSNKAPIPFDCTDPTFLKAYLNMYRSLGVDFDWIDWQQGTKSAIPGIDPLWILNHFHYLDNRKLNTPPLIFSRYAGPGSHRYPVGFSGDTHVTWASLQFQPEFTATASNIGYGWWSHDIGGHMFGERSDELVTRWVQLGAFSPFLRLHSTLSRWMSKEPWRYTAEAQTAITSMLRLRHQLIPYLHTMNVRSYHEDEPLVQPVYWHYPLRDEAFEYKNTFYFGSSLFVAPITTPRSPVTLLGSVQAWLPPGPRHWVDIFTGTAYDADRLHTLYRPLDQIPVLAGEGTVLVLDADERPPFGAHNPSALAIVLVPGADASFTLVEHVADDPPSYGAHAAGSNEERRTTFTWKQAARTLQIEATGPAWARPYTVRLVGTHPAPPPQQVDGGEWRAPDGVSVELGSAPLTDRLQPLLERYQCKFERKQTLWDAATGGSASPADRARTMLQLTGTDETVGPVAELMLANVG